MSFPDPSYRKFPIPNTHSMCFTLPVDATHTILLGDDSPDDVELLKVALKRADLQNPVRVCADGQQIIDYLQGNGVYADRSKFPFPRLLFLDLRMPKLNGLDVLRWVKEHPTCSVIPTVILTSDGRKQDVHEAYTLGANAVMTKPFDLTKMKAVFKDLFCFWSHCELPDLPT